MTLEHSLRSKVWKKTGGPAKKTHVVQERTNAQLYSHITLAGNRTRATGVRGKSFTHKPPMPPRMASQELWAQFHRAANTKSS